MDNSRDDFWYGRPYRILAPLLAYNSYSVWVNYKYTLNLTAKFNMPLKLFISPLFL